MIYRPSYDESMGRRRSFWLGFLVSGFVAAVGPSNTSFGSIIFHFIWLIPSKKVVDSIAVGGVINCPVEGEGRQIDGLMTGD